MGGGRAAVEAIGWTGSAAAFATCFLLPPSQPVSRGVLAGLALALLAKALLLRAHAGFDPLTTRGPGRWLVALLVPPTAWWPGADQLAANRTAGLVRIARSAAKAVALAACAWLLTRWLPSWGTQWPMARWAARGVIEACVVYLGLSGLGDLVIGLVGFGTGARFNDVFAAPFAPRSLADFWGRRWNLYVRDLLHRFVFVPVARRWRASLAVLACFAVSGVAHEALALGAVGWSAWRPGLMLGFFVIHGVGVLGERALGWGHGRFHGALVLAFVLATTPAFVAALRPFADVFVAAFATLAPG